MRTIPWKPRSKWSALVVIATALGVAASFYPAQAQESQKIEPRGKTSYFPVAITEPFSELFKKLSGEKKEAMRKHKAFLEQRYDLSDRPVKGVTMYRGKPIQEGPRAKLPKGQSWESLTGMSPDEIRSQGVFPPGFMPLPHPIQAQGGMTFPQPTIDELKKQEDRDLTRFDLDFDLPDHLMPVNAVQPDRGQA